MKQVVGLYFGTDTIGGVLVENKKVIMSVKFDLASIEDAGSVQTDSEVLWEALVNKTLRALNAQGKTVFVSVADKEFVTRSFEIPLTNKKEIETSLVFEAGKHLPFKLEEVVADYSYNILMGQRKTRVSFVAAKKDIFKKYQDIITHLDLDSTVFEPGAISLARCIKSNKKFAKLRDYALIDITGNEANINFYNGDILVFSRHLAGANAGSLDEEKIIESIRLSFQYFEREFRNYKVDKVIGLFDAAYEHFMTSLKNELQKEVELLIPQEFIPNEMPSVEQVKALGVVLRRQSTYKVKPVFRVMGTEMSLDLADLPVPLNWPVILSVATVAALVLIFLSLIMGNMVTMKKIAIERERKVLEVPVELESKSSGQIESINLKFSKSIASVDALVKRFKPLSSFLKEISLIRSKGLWFDKLNLSLKEDKYQGDISGEIFRGDAYQEGVGIDEFAEKIRSSSVVMSLFSG
ncbi:MAG: pilus assembly protein PilM, partial [Candidatus Omnitrophota bacterium]